MNSFDGDFAPSGGWQEEQGVLPEPVPAQQTVPGPQNSVL